MNEQIFQKVFDLIQEHLPTNWKKVALFAGYATGSYSINFYVMNEEGLYVECYKLWTAPKAILIKLFIEINKILEQSRKAENGQFRWTVFTMIVDCKGNMKTYFDYEDISEYVIAYEKKWKEKYLK